MLLGPLNGLFLAGKLASPLIAALTGAKIYKPSDTFVDVAADFYYAFSNMNDGDFAEALDDLLTGIGKATPSPVTFYPILKRRLDWLYD